MGKTMMTVARIIHIPNRFGVCFTFDAVKHLFAKSKHSTW